jgi:hypothetical protein
VLDHPADEDFGLLRLTEVVVVLVRRNLDVQALAEVGEVALRQEVVAADGQLAAVEEGIPLRRLDERGQ